MDNGLPQELQADINEIKSVLLEANRTRLVDAVNKLVKIATTKQIIEESLDESKEAMTPLGSTIIEIGTVIINHGESNTEAALGA